jgi:hypothetical protein
MRLLVKNQKENEPKEPVIPDKEEAKWPFMMKSTKRYDEHKGKIFVIEKGQCTLDMKNKVENLKGHDLIVKQMMMSSARQQDNEPSSGCYKKFTSCVDVGESQWGTPV